MISASQTDDIRKKTFNEINITPLTDIFLVLLIIMMVIAPILDQQGLSLAIPEYVEENSQNQESKILNVTVTADDKYLLNGSEVAEEELVSTIKEQSKEYKDGLMIEADGDSSHQAVVRLMDSARNAGVHSISISEI